MLVGLLVSTGTSDGITFHDTNTTAVKLYFANLGGDSPIIFWSLFLGGMTLTCLTETFQAWYLGYWAEQYKIRDPADVNVV